MSLLNAIQQKSCSAAIEARIGGGKTTLAKSFIRDIPLTSLVFVPTKEVMQEYRGIKVKRAYKTLSKKRFEYYLSRMRGNNIVFEDIPMWIRSPKEEEELDILMCNIFSGIRKRKYSIFATTYDLGTIPRRTLWSFSFYIFLRGGTWHLARLAGRGIPSYVCWFAQKLRQNIPDFHYFVIDTIMNRITKPAINTYTAPLFNCFTGMPTDSWSFDELMTSKNKGSKSGGRPKMPNGYLSPKAQKIISILKSNPSTDLRKLAKELGMANSTMYNWIQRLKKQEHLDKDVRYGAPRK